MRARVQSVICWVRVQVLGWGEEHTHNARVQYLFSGVQVQILGFGALVWARNILGHPHMVSCGPGAKRFASHPCVASTQ